jgi:hypothetical protein
MSWMELMGQRTLNWKMKTKSKFAIVNSLMAGCCLMRWRKLEMRKLLSIPHRLLQVIGAGLLIHELADQIDLALV